MSVTNFDREAGYGGELDAVALQLGPGGHSLHQRRAWAGVSREQRRPSYSANVAMFYLVFVLPSRLVRKSQFPYEIWN